MSGYHKSSIFGMSLVETFIISESRAQVRQLLNQALVGINVGEMELPILTKKVVSCLARECFIEKRRAREYLRRDWCWSRLHYTQANGSGEG